MAGLSGHVRAHHGREGAPGREKAAQLTHEQGRATALQLDHGERAMLCEGRRGLAAGSRKSHPELQTPEAPHVARGRLFRVRDPPPGRHEVEHPGAGRPLEPETVVVDQLSFEQPGDGLEADVRMRSHVHRFARGEGQRTVGVEEAPGPHQATPAARQQAPDGKAAQVGQPPGQRLEGRSGGGLADARHGRGGR